MAKVILYTLALMVLVSAGPFDFKVPESSEECFAELIKSTEHRGFMPKLRDLELAKCAVEFARVEFKNQAISAVMHVL
jgi:hypothetical protein